MRHIVAAPAVVVPLPRKRKKTNRITQPTAALIAALCTVGAFSGRAAAPPRPVPRPPEAFAAPSRGLLVRPRASTMPTAFPRCLLRRLRFVWAMGQVYAADPGCGRLRTATRAAP